MNNSDFDDAVTEIVLEISKLHKKMTMIFPKENEHILRHFAASSIHLAFFMRDYCFIVLGIKENMNTIELKFLEECGCNFNRDK